MRLATSTELERIAELRGADTKHSPVLRFLISHPRAWCHTHLNEVKIAGNLDDQIEALIAEGAAEDHQIDIIVIPGNRDGGFFARAY